MLRILCLVLFWLLAALYLLALFAFIIGTFGWFGAEQDPLSGIFLVPLGAPWTNMINLFPESTWPALAAVAPVINLAILYGFYRWLGKERQAE